jgi:hypothetical protein
MTNPNNAQTFLERLDPYLKDFESIDLRAVALKKGKQLICLGGRAVLKDQKPSELPLHPDLVNTDSLIMLQERLPIKALPTLIKQISQGKLPVDGRRLVLITKDHPISAGFQDTHHFYFSDSSYYIGFSLHWAAGNLQEVVPYQQYHEIDRKLGAVGAGYSDIVDLFESFMPQFQFERQQGAKIEVQAPVLITGRVKLLEQSIDINLSVGRRIDLSAIQLIALHKESQDRKSVIRRTKVHAGPSDWTKSDTGYAFRRLLQKKEGERFCELLVSYRGETVYTASDGIYQAPFSFLRNQEPGVAKEGETAPLKNGEKDEVVLISADFKGSTKLKEKFGTEAARPLLDDWENHFKAVAPMYHGLVLSWKGDGGLAYFRGKHKFEDAYAAALHLLYYTAARAARPILDGAPVGVRIAVHTGILQGEPDPGSIKSHDIDIVCHLEGKFTPRNSIVATGTYLKKCPERIRKHFSGIGEGEGEALHKTDLGAVAAALEEPSTEGTEGKGKS